ncbi:uroporphyrinogen decarboxylase family protein [Methanosarcina sp. KYL-1]|uniref:uroporphyrinogen decarboxylase family protein n=1 Tax=Methanosarcina sp. KYL-1 TaxID=2602068 RepID=UPI0021006922|nr:uroporphyrinogen decarboxylase family protein [Methanosarcina sp. KYL-1]
MKEEMSPMERVLSTLSFEEPDHVPFFLLLTVQGAREVGVSIKEYYSNPEYVARAQLRMQERYGHDCLYSFYYAALELEAWGGKAIFYEDGPTNAGRPVISSFEEIESLEAPSVPDTRKLQKVLETTAILKENVGDEIPIIGVVMSPFSLPVMQLGFSSYLDLIYEAPEHFEALMQANEDFCVEWANAQLEAGATAICYFDPVSSTTIMPREMYLKTGFEVAKRTLAKIKGPTGTHMASGRSLPILGDLIKTGTSIVGTSTLEDLAEVKKACEKQVTVMGNLNAIEMCRWTPETAESAVRTAISKAASGGGFILSDNHGEIPWQVPHEVLMDLSKAVKKWGRYPGEKTNE